MHAHKYPSPKNLTGIKSLTKINVFLQYNISCTVNIINTHNMYLQLVHTANMLSLYHRPQTHHIHVERNIDTPVKVNDTLLLCTQLLFI